MNQTSTIFAIILAAIFLKERLTGRKLLAVTLAMAGVVVVTLGDAVYTRVFEQVRAGLLLEFRDYATSV